MAAHRLEDKLRDELEMAAVGIAAIQQGQDTDRLAERLAWIGRRVRARLAKP